jgi:KaiC/GvpD/RAD55 family RecA-like ATPase
MYDDRRAAVGEAAADHSSIFEITGGQRLHELAKSSEPQRWLFGEFWAEGEMAILFGDHGTGKSVLAAQIADGIARGSSGSRNSRQDEDPFEVSSKGSAVMFLDLEQTAQEFAARYSTGSKAYKFTRNFQHFAVDPFAEVPSKYTNFVEYLCVSVEDIVRRQRPKALIVDSLAHLKRSNDITRDVLPFVRLLSRLKRELGLSVLLVAPSQRRLGSKTLEIGDMQGGRGLCSFADSVFAIGTSGSDTTRRYLKQLKVRRRELLYDRTHTVAMEVEKDVTGLLSLVFDKFAIEMLHYRNSTTVRDWDMVEKAKKMHDEGKTYNFIGIVLGISKTSAHRLVQMWVPIHPDCPQNPNKKEDWTEPIELEDSEMEFASDDADDDTDDDTEPVNEDSRIWLEIEKDDRDDDPDPNVRDGSGPEDGSESGR